MKKLVLIALAAIISLSASAQDSLSAKKSFTPVQGDRVLTFGIFNNTAFWARKVYRSNGFAMRGGITGSYFSKPTNTSETTTTTPGGTTTTYSTTMSQRNFSIGIYKGVQKSFGNLERVEPYIGWDIGFNYANQYEYNKNTSYATISTGQTTEMTRTSPANFNLGFLPLVGVNYYITPKLAIGAEYRFTIFNVGYTTNSKTEYNVTDTQTGVQTSSSVTEQKTGNFSFNGSFTGQAYITVSLILGDCTKCMKK